MIGRMVVRAATASVLLSIAATAAMAQTGSAPNYDCPTGEAAATTCINGGGSSLAAFVYAAPATTSPAFSGGELTVYAASTGGTSGFSYEKASSGAGQQAFEANNPADFNGTTESGYAVHFAASDSYINSSSVLFPYVGAGHPMVSGGQFIQMPMFATPITIPVENVHMGMNGAVTLKDSDLCGIFSGLITNWNKTSVSKQLAPGTIHVYWRNDYYGSGTSFLLTQHLASVCNSSNTLSGFTFSATSKFATLFNGVHGVTVSTPASNSSPWVIPVATDGSFANFVGAKGSGGVADGVNNDSTDSALGYVSPDYTSIAKTPATTSAAKPYTKLFVASLLNAVNDTAYLPNLANVTLSINNPGSAVNAAPPALTAANLANAATQTNWVPEIPTPTKGYPIVGYTNWLVAQCYAKKTVTNSVTGFLQKHYNGTYATLLNNNGFVPLVGGIASGYGAAINKAFLTNGSGLNLNIGNATACKGLTGR
jgi:hypothetical protein